MFYFKTTARKVGVIGTTLAVATTLAACSGNDPGSGSGSASSAESGTLSWPSHFWSEPGNIQPEKVRDKYKAAHPNVKLLTPPIPFADYHNKVYTQMASGQAPDVVVPYDPQIGQWEREGLLEPLNDCLTSHNIDSSKFISTQKLAEYEGKTYGVLLVSNPRVLVYNKKLLKEAGVAVPKDINQLMAAIKAMRVPSKQQFGFATLTGSTSPADTYINLMPTVAGFGGAFVTDGKPTANSPETVAALTFQKELYDKGLVPKGTIGSAAQDAFTAGKIGMFISGPFIIAQAEDAHPDVAKDLSAEALPLPGGHTASVNVFLSIPKSAKNKKGACDLIAGALDDDVQKITAPSIPATGQYDPAFLAKNPYFQAVLDAAKVAQSYAPVGAEKHMADVAKIVTDVYQEMLTSSMTGQEAGAKMQSKLEDLLKN